MGKRTAEVKSIEIGDVKNLSWTCIAVDDVGDGIDAYERPDYFEACEMCGQEGVRYFHVMEHPSYNEYLRVGYRCSEKMEDDYINSLQREKEDAVFFCNFVYNI